jgi:hypothetical protein
MSVQASWGNNNQIGMNRHKILLTDVDLAKKNEWNRRRRIRLQQVNDSAMVFVLRSYTVLTEMNNYIP